MFGIFIFGNKPVEKKIRSGFFHCPRCQRDMAYSHYEVRQYFSAYFVPLIPLGSRSELIRCNACGTDYPVEVLQSGYEKVQSAFTPWKCAGCGNSNPPEYANCVACNRKKSG